MNQNNYYLTELCNVVILYIVYIMYYSMFYIFIYYGGRSCAFCWAGELEANF